MSENVVAVPLSPERAKNIVEALLFASAEPLHEKDISVHAMGFQVEELLLELKRDYEGRGVRLECHERRWAFRTAPELQSYMSRDDLRPRRLSKAAMETLAIIAYQQPVTRAEIEAVRGVSVASGTLDLLVEASWVMPKGRRDAPGSPVTWVTTPDFLDYFDLDGLGDLPRLDELEGAALFKLEPGA